MKESLYLTIPTTSVFLLNGKYFEVGVNNRNCFLGYSPQEVFEARHAHVYYGPLGKYFVTIFD